MARVDGDEFAVIVWGGMQKAIREAGALRTALQRPLELHDLTLLVEGRVGISSYPDHGSDVPLLLQRAELALHRAKSVGIGSEVYSAEHDEPSRERLALVGELGRAIDRGELEVWYQPMASLETGRVTGVEALVRWRHPTHGLLGPAAFLPMVEQTGLMKPLTLHVLDAALRQCADWRRAGLDLSVSVNLSATNLIDRDLPSDVTSQIETRGLDPAALHLEVTESVVMADPDRAREVLSGLRASGVRIALDDFGTGYSSLGYLKNLPVDELKLDRSFVAEVATSARDAAIVRATIELARAVDLQTVAEGVETADAWEFLHQIGCDYAQGYLLSKPAPASELTEWLAGRARVARDASVGDGRRMDAQLSHASRRRGSSSPLPRPELLPPVLEG